MGVFFSPKVGDVFRPRFWDQTGSSFWSTPFLGDQFPTPKCVRIQTPKFCPKLERIPHPNFCPKSGRIPIQFLLQACVRNAAWELV